VFFTVSKVLWFFATPSNLLPSLILFGLVLQMPGRTRRLGQALTIGAALLLAAAGLSPLANWIILPLEQRFAPVQDDGRPVAGVIVLGGSVQAEEALARGQLLLNDAGERVVALADLARRHPDAAIVFSGGSGTVLRNEIPEAAGLARFAETLGIARERIRFEDRSRTTRESAIHTRALVAPMPGERWLLVTSAWHMPRSVGVFRKAGFAVEPYPVDFRTRGPDELWRPFAFVSEGLRRLDVGAKEWAGLVGYRLAGYTDELFPGPSPSSGLVMR
jgi:uncharacterized SAM-binding protein YcdF (DUF218 family)